MNWILKMAAAAVFLPGVLWAQTNSAPKISADEAKNYIGKTVTVTGRVAEVHFSEKLVRLNLDKPFPGQPFTAVIFANRTNYFKDLSALKGAAVEVSGPVAEYRSRPEIVINRTNQLLVLPGTGK